ncbi:MAG: hypothetical protein AAGG81_03670 [Chlamydiota bacterium]
MEDLSTRFGMKKPKISLSASSPPLNLGRLAKEYIENVYPENRYNRNDKGGGSTAHQI